MKKVYSFLRQLARHQDREWFAANKGKYLESKELTDSFAQELIDLISEIDPDAKMLRVSDVTYRIYRDTRFSSDKTPYKTHIGIFVNPPFGKKSMRCGYYFHIEPGNSLICAGNMPLPGPITKAIRQSIYDNVEEYMELIEDPEFKRYFPVVGSEHLKTAPKGFPKDWEHIDLLKPKDFGVYMRVDDGFFEGKDRAERLRPIIAQMKRFNDFVNYAIDEAEGRI